MRRAGAEDGQGPAASTCPACRCPRPAMVCPACVGALVVGERKALLAQLGLRRAELLAAIKALMCEREVWQQQELKQRRLESGLRDISIKATNTESQIKQVRLQIVQLRQKNTSRSSRLAQLTNELTQKRAEVLVHHFSDVIRCQGLRHSMVMEQLVTEQRRRLSALLQIFPLRITALRSSTGSSNGAETLLPIPCVSVANLRLPDSVDQIYEASQQSQQSLAAALGYMLLLTQLLAHYLGAPVGHIAAFGASSSSVWEPASSVDPQSEAEGKRLPLYPSRTGGTLSDSSHSSPGAGGPGSNAQTEFAELSQGVKLLERSVSMICHAKMVAAVGACPEDWSPFALLAWMFAQISLQQGEGCTGDASAAMSPASTAGPSRVMSPQQGAAEIRQSDRGHAASSSNNPWTTLNDAGLNAQMLLGDPAAPDIRVGDETEANADCDDWDIVQRPFLPPPPSQPDEVEHWTRAMFTDAHRAAAQRSGGENVVARTIRQRMSSFTQNVL